MKITRRSLVSGVERTLDLDITESQIRAWKDGMLAQNAFPNLSADDREFVMTGIVREEWEKLARDE